MSPLQVGVASVDFTPEPGLPLMGNFRSDYAARGVHDPLRARALVLAGEPSERAAVLALDICMLDRQNVAFLREVIAAECDLPPENVSIHATHTHSAPAPSGMLGMEAEVAPHAAAIERFLRKAATAVVQASRRMEEAAALEIGSVTAPRVSFNRRLRRRDGATRMNWEALQPGFDPAEILSPWGPVDEELVCLAARFERRTAALVNFGLHPAILAGDNWLYSADYPGYLAEAVARFLGGGSTCLFLNGCCGDVNHVDYRDRSQGRGYAMAERVGSILANAANEALSAAAPIEASPLRVSRERVVLDRQRIDPEERRWCEDVLEQAQRRPPQGQVDGLPDAYFARLRLEMARVENQPDEVEVMVIRLGDAAIVGLPGEAFCRLGLEIKRRSPARHTIVAGLCNDAIGYLPTRESFTQGGYETTTGSTFYEPGSAEKLVQSALGQLERLFAAPDSHQRRTAGDGSDGKRESKETRIV